MLNQNIQIHRNIHRISDYSIVVFLFGLALWIAVPILGIFPLLIAVQLNLLKPNVNSKNIALLNNLILILVVLTVSIFFSSYTVWNDVALYVDSYRELANITPFEAAAPYGAGFDFVIFLLAYPIYYLTNGSTYAFLFSHGLILNSLVVFVISQKLSPKYYPILLFLVFSSPAYYFQVMVMRHALSNVFLMAAIATLESPPIYFLSYSFLSAFSHFSNFIYVFILTLLKINTQFNYFRFKRQNKLTNKTGKNLVVLIIIAMGIVGTLSLVQGTEFLKNTVYLTQALGFIDVADILEQRNIYYNKNSVEIGFNIIYNVIFAVPIIGIFVSVFKKHYISLKKLGLIIIFLAQFMAYIFVNIQGFSWRAYFLFLSMYGLFTAILVEDNLTSLKNMREIFLTFLSFILMLNIAIFLSQVRQGWLIGQEHQFFNGKILQTNIFDYIVFFFNATPN